MPERVYALILKTVLLCIVVLYPGKARLQNIDYNSTIKSIINLGKVEEANEDFSSYANLETVLKDVEIVMLGEQSHGEGTTYETKIKLIKYLHKKMGFDLLVFESGFYDCQKAWSMMESGEDVRDALGMSLFALWSTTKDMIPLTNYIEATKKSDNPLKVLGFDSQFTGRYAKNHFTKELSTYLATTPSALLHSTEWNHFISSINLLLDLKIKTLKKNQPGTDLLFINKLINEIGQYTPNLTTEKWIQVLKSLHSYLSDMAIGTDTRDKQMAENLFWIKRKHPGRKIICWGATSHFLYSAKKIRMKSPVVQLLGANYYKKIQMMGEYVKNELLNKVYIVGFTAYEGEYNLFKKKKIKKPGKGTLEYLLSKSPYDNILLFFGDLDLKGYKSRPLGNFYMKTPIHEVMDAVIFNREMRRPILDRNFFLKIYPENKYIKPEVLTN